MKPADKLRDMIGVNTPVDVASNSLVRAADALDAAEKALSEAIRGLPDMLDRRALQDEANMVDQMADALVLIRGEASNG